MAKDKGKLPLISVIVPTYNRETYIERCIRSIANQTYKNIEIIIINDGSTDNTASICKNMADADNRIRVFSKKNEGSGYARNAGINLARGDYIFFVDSDDFIWKTCLERMFNVLQKESADIVKCSHISGNDEIFLNIPKLKPYKTYTNIQAFKTRKMNIAIWGKLFKRAVIENKRYPKVTLYDDEYFTYQCIYSASKIIILDEIMYYVYMSSSSIMRTDRKRTPFEIINAYDKRITYFKQYNEKELIGISQKELAIRLMLLYIQTDPFNNKDSNIKSIILNEFRKRYKKGKKYTYGLKEKVSLSFFDFAPNSFVKIISLVNIYKNKYFNRILQ